MSVPVIFSKLFSSFPQISFGFSTRQGGITPDPFDMNLSFNVGDDRTRVMQNRRKFLQSVQIAEDQLAIPKQVHGDTVHRAERPGEYQNCDGLITNNLGVFLSVKVADCLPIFFFDPSSNSIAAVHAGWRGSAQKIVQRAVALMVAEFSTRPETMLVYIGPSSRVCCYEVGEEVASKFHQQFLSRKADTRPHLDMHSFTVSLLREMGVKDSHIEVSPYCTICTPELFHSYRRDGARSGRMMGTIGIRRC